MFPSISGFIGGTVDSAVLMSLAIILCAILIEDVTTVIVGVLAADNIIPVPLAVMSLYVGIIIGDAVLYSIGWLARTHPRLAHYIEHDLTAPIRSWLENRYAFKVFSGHFIPGFRFTTFVASGFFRFPLRTYMPMAIVGGLVLLSVLFSVSYWFGSITTGWVSHARWGIAAAFILALIFIGRHNIMAYRASQSKL
jgi:membrane protein DedA with SNARE-associated domain